jgi:hypothetical protein
MAIINKGILNSGIAYLRQAGNDWPTAQVVVSGGGTTADVIESSSNLYFTNARVVSALTPGNAITIEANGRISLSGITTAIDNTVITTANNTLSYSMGRIITDPKNILVIAEGLIQIPTTDYTVSGSSLVFTSQPPVNTNVEVRFFGTSQSIVPTTIVATTNTFVGDGANTQYTLTVIPASKDYLTVIIDGVAQLSDAYSVSGTTLTFTEAPANSANIDVRLLTAAPSAAAILAGQNITIEANGRISSTATGGGTSSDFNPISFMLAGM